MRFIAVSCVFLSLSVVASADDLRKSILEMNSLVSKSMKSGDLKGLEAVMKRGVSPDFKYVESGYPGKPMNFDQMVSTMKMGMSMFKKVTVAESKLLTLKETGNKAISTSVHTVGGILVGPDKKTHQMMSAGLSTDTYRKVKGTWQMISMNFKTTSMTMDGKPMDMSKMK